MHKLLEDKASMRYGAEMMVMSRNVRMADGSLLSMELWDTWSEEEQKGYITQFLQQRWEKMSAAEKEAEARRMPQDCFKCGVRNSYGADDTVAMGPCPLVGYTRLICETCALKEAKLSAQPSSMVLNVRPHPEYNWDPTEGAAVRLHGIRSRDELNGRTGKLLKEFGARWAVRLDDSSETIKLKPSNFTPAVNLTFKLPPDGSTTVRELRDMVREKIGKRYMPQQISLWRHGQRLEVEDFDAKWSVRDTLLRDHGLDANVADPTSLVIEVLVADALQENEDLRSEPDDEPDINLADLDLVAKADASSEGGTVV
ncbi:hypothetical protein AB1Y20_015670 [Prymnesium parvum]|uniref:Ubiquitin-like domain-containing protein n=1 Tax=Prymnesium parvum TaxID=97485 RepID=A0AB34K255_PRYPA